MPAQYGYPSAIQVRASGSFIASTGSTETSDQFAYGGVTGMIISVDQTAVSASTVGGGTGSLVHTIQYKDPIGGTYIATTGVITATTGIAVFALQCWPGSSSVAPTSAGMGKSDLAVPNVWRISSASNSSSTDRTYSISAIYLPTAGSSST